MEVERKQYFLTAASDRAEIETLFFRFQLPIPGDFYQSDGCQFLVGKLLLGEQIIGIAVGSYRENEREFSLLMFYIVKEMRSTPLVCFAIEQLLHLAEEKFRTEKIIWKYEVKDKNMDSYLQLLRQIHGYSAVVHDVCEKNLVTTKEFPFFRHSESFYGARTIEKKGFQVLLWKDCDDLVKEQFKKMQQSADEERKGLLPLVGEDYDPETSRVVLEKATGRVATWMICRRMTPEKVEIRRWYTLEEFRESRIGLIFGAYMLGVLGKRYAFIQYQMVDGNRSMMGFTCKYFGNALIERRYVRYLDIVKDDGIII